jgi:hypothetical protein
MKNLLLVLASAAMISLIVFLMLIGQAPNPESQSGSPAVLLVPQVQRYSETDEIESKTIYVPDDWRHYITTLADYRGAIDDGWALSLIAVAAYEIDHNKALPSILVFWLNNRISNIVQAKKVTLYAFSKMGRPTTKLEMLPPTGRDWIKFSVGGAHVLPIEIDEEDVPTQLAVLVELRSGEKHVFVVLGVREMFDMEWNLFCKPPDDPKCDPPRFIGMDEWGHRNRELFGIDRNNMEVIRFKESNWEGISASEDNQIQYILYLTSGAAAMQSLTVAKLITLPAGGVNGDPASLVHVETQRFVK